MLGESLPESGYVFACADINCTLEINLNGKFERFGSFEDAKKILGLPVEGILDQES